MKRNRFKEIDEPYPSDFGYDIADLLRGYGFLISYLPTNDILFGSNIPEKDSVKIQGFVDLNSKEMEIEISYLNNEGLSDFIDTKNISLRSRSAEGMLEEIEDELVHYLNIFRRKVDVMNKLVDAHFN